MKKIPTAYKRIYETYTDKKGRKRSKIIGIENEFTNDLCKKAVEEGLATIKLDGAACALIDGKFYKRFDAKPGREIPEGAIPCSEPDPITGHWPHWVPVSRDNPSDKWFLDALRFTHEVQIHNEGIHTYEAIGPKFNGNPECCITNVLIPHNPHECVIPECRLAEVERTYDGIRGWLENHEQEGLVFWLNGEPVCKIKRSDFGFKWPLRQGDTGIYE